MNLSEFNEKLDKILTERIKSVVKFDDHYKVNGVRIKPATYKTSDEVLWLFIDFYVDGKRHYKMLHVKPSGYFNRKEFFIKLMEMLKDKLEREQMKRSSDAMETSVINGLDAKVIKIRENLGIDIDVQVLPSAKGQVGLIFLPIVSADVVLDHLLSCKPTQ